jgi:subtilase family serine protease
VTMRARSLSIHLAVLVMAVACPLSTEATVVGVLAERSLTDQAQVIVIGQVSNIVSHWDPQQNQILTDITMSLDEILKGAVTTPELTIRQLGGRVGDLESRVEGGPQFHLGERVLLFLTTRRDGTLRVAHLYLGKFSIVTDVLTGEALAHRETPVGVVVTAPPGPGGPPTTDELHKLRDFRDRIRSIVRSRPLSRLRGGNTAPVLTPAAPVGTSEAQGFFTFLGTPSRWFEPDTGGAVIMLRNADGEPRAPSLGFDQIGAAFAAWSSVSGSSFRYQDGGTTTGFGHRRDGVNTVSFGDPLGQMDDPVNCGGVLAMGGYFSSSSQQRTVNGQTFNRIVEGDVVVNRGWDGCGFYDRFANLAEVLTHELGHVLGLGHSADADATMAARAHFDGRGATLRADDMAGLRFLYPGASGAPDLMVEGVSASPTAINAGSNVTVRYTVANRGTTAVSGSYGERVYLSSDATLDATDTLLATVPARTTSLAANATLGVSHSVPIPSSVAANTYRVIVLTDASAGIVESNESNNTASAPVTVRASTGAPDLVVSGLSAPGTAVIGTSILVTDTTRNQSNAAAGASTTQFFLSADTVLGPGDHAMGMRSVGPLAAGATSTGSVSLTIPVGVPPGTYRLLAATDALAAVAESNELNNSRGVALVLTTTPSGGTGVTDLVVSGLSGPGTAVIGTSILVTDTTRNQGSAAAGASTTQFFLSADTILGPGDHALGGRSVGPLAAGAASSGSVSLTIPVGVPPGTYHLLAATDALAAVAESNELNNSRGVTLVLQ